ncbi:phenylacetic acid catabolic [Rhodovulum sp. BSW8]|uniref:Phenylacetate-CoA oxygenase subunit PaaI n=1 Tax=Rhodovulum visakhapatnamense TaxID=364297 RepID=A0ABS1RDR7_9RHOB|nr:MULTISPECIES: Phenylacetic acid catabolic protein [Rhodovulum]MBL3569953.1 phenylacetate-CoA oxygenase subunit PaaI [Rhodovulum visakhapatnamense]MBL3577425.1 phenylacetate-CoA oxygenase subunit PaaI [Rhodovulum visakhapatnamense]OLS43412.1 phenylacetic acid catabolic [Rhodovulum sulfidophilum]RBO52369.1 phenylacetic acid catabolic [Rhodovulum sp. BSW8]
MTEISLDDYLARGGKLTAPTNVPARYRGELLRLMSSFVDSELAGSAGFADAINRAPGIRERIAASRIVLEKADHAERVLDLMSAFGTDKTRYEQAHDWAARGPREAQIGAHRQGADMRLSVFHYPLQGWVDAVAMNVLMGLATGVQLAELARASYTPFAEAIREIAPREARHAELGLEGLAKLVAGPAGRAEAQDAIAYWMPRVAATFGQADSPRFETLRRMGLRHRTNEALLAEWRALAEAELSRLNLN